MWIQGQENEKISTFLVDFFVLLSTGTVVDPDSMKLWIRIRIESIRIHNPGLNKVKILVLISTSYSFESKSK
jgi:hypothetical protein